MTQPGLYLLAGSVFLFFLAFSTGAPAFLAPAVLLLLVLLFSFLSVLLCRRGLKVDIFPEKKRVSRGEEAALILHVVQKSRLPVCPLQAVLFTDGEQARQLEIPCERGTTSWRVPFLCPHAGVLHPGVQHFEITDLFRLFRLTYRMPDPPGELLVLPTPFDVEPLSYAQLDEGLGTMARASEDISIPADIRSYQTGDPMKRIHWKLSLRKQELLVRRFDEAVLPDALLLLDCERPASASPALRDALLETALSVMTGETGHDHQIHMPLMGRHPTEVDGRMGVALAAENLARLEWSRGSAFEEVLLLEAARLRHVGAAVIITSRLSGELVEVMRQMRRMGPTLRLYYVTDQPESSDVLPFISRLQHADCEVCYVTPAGGGERS